MLISKQPNTLPINVKYITTFQCCICYRSNKHVGYNYFIYAIYVLFCIFYRSLWNSLFYVFNICSNFVYFISKINTLDITTAISIMQYYIL